MFSCTVDAQTELRLVERHHAEELFKLLEANRDHLRPWHPWVDLIRSVADVQKAIGLWQRQHAESRGFYAGIWFQGKFCGIVNHMGVDWPNRSTILSYWLDAAHQGRGIMTASCRAMMTYAFTIWKLNRITIECAAENKRSRGVPERLGFKLEGVARQVEWLHDHFADHAIYGCLQADFPSQQTHQTVKDSGPA